MIHVHVCILLSTPPGNSVIFDHNWKDFIVGGLGNEFFTVGEGPTEEI